MCVRVCLRVWERVGMNCVSILRVCVCPCVFACVRVGRDELHVHFECLCVCACVFACVGEVRDELHFHFVCLYVPVCLRV